MLSKLKFAGISTIDLLSIYKLFIRSVTEYASVVFHTSLSQELSKKLECIQATCLKIILGNEYTSYSEALQKCSLQSLYNRREQRLTNFALQCTKDKFNSKMFPKNQNSKLKETYVVNFARTSTYLNSTIPQAQRRLNIISSCKK